MSEIVLNWKNKGLTLRASGLHDYTWVEPVDGNDRHPTKLISLSECLPGPDSNAVIIGDGLDAMVALDAQTDFFQEKIRLVYVDPPFNTNADVEFYNDAMDRAMWLSMLRDRIVSLRPHLAIDASFWIHLDDSEVHRARLVLDEALGEESFVSSIVWQKRTTRESRSAFSVNHDTILVYAPSGSKKWKKSRNLLEKRPSQIGNRDNDPRGPWTDAPFTAPGYRAAQQYPIQTPSGATLTPPRGRSWYATEPIFKRLFEENRLWFPKNGEGSPRIKLFNDQVRGLVPSTIWESDETGTNDDAKRHLMALFPDKPVFDTPKPEELLERIIHIATRPGDLVVDLFGGSGTTAAAAHKMQRRWLLVERSHETVRQFIVPRLEAVIEGRDPAGVTGSAKWRGGGDYELAYAPPLFGKVLSARQLSAVAELHSHAVKSGKILPAETV